MASQNLVGDDSGTQTGQQNNATTIRKEQTSQTDDKPGRRIYNPLSKYASYTYNLSLYMITPSAYEAFMAGGRKNISRLAGGVYLVAQTGGIDDKSTILRAPGFEFDYYIDNLKFKTTSGAKAGLLDTNATHLEFNIIEPNGFSLVNKLARAAREIGAQLISDSSNPKNKPNAMRQFFILAIRFIGYDTDGNMVKQDDVIERYLDIYITSLRFKIDGKHTNYAIKAASLTPQMAVGNKNGRLNKTTTVIGSTVESVLSGVSVDITENGKTVSAQSLISILNAEQEKWSKENGFLPMTYAIEFIGDGVEDIKNAKLQTKNDVEKLGWPTQVPGLVLRTTDSMQESKVADVAGNINANRQITFLDGTNIIKAISLVISRSSYLTDALKVVYENTTSNYSSVTNNTQDEFGKPINPNNNLKPVRWFSLSTRISDVKYDSKRRDYVYKITYVIQPYETPNVVSSFAGVVSKYYGPHKTYEYWFTGKNNEIISYEQTMNNNYYLTDYIPDASAVAGGTQSQIPSSVGQLSNIDRTNYLGIGGQAQASYLNNLYSPGDYAAVKIRILGDPDFIMQDTLSSVNDVYQKFYGSDGFTINPYGGQVFIEIDFKEAIDYDYEENDGLMSINDSILFWGYPPELRQRIKGNSYQLVSVDNEFNRGSFIQTLNAVINPLTSEIQELQRKKTENVRGRSDDFLGIEDEPLQPQNLIPSVTATEYYGDITTLGPDTVPQVQRAISTDAGRER